MIRKTCVRLLGTISHHDDLLHYSTFRDSTLRLRRKIQNTPSVLTGVVRVIIYIDYVLKLVHILLSTTTHFISDIFWWYSVMYIHEINMQKHVCSLNNSALTAKQFGPRTGSHQRLCQTACHLTSIRCRTVHKTCCFLPTSHIFHLRLRSQS